MQTLTKRTNAIDANKKRGRDYRGWEKKKGTIVREKILKNRRRPRVSSRVKYG